MRREECAHEEGGMEDQTMTQSAREEGGREDETLPQSAHEEEEWRIRPCSRVQEGWEDGG